MSSIDTERYTMNSKRIARIPSIAIAILVGVLGTRSVVAATESDNLARLSCRFDATSSVETGSRDVAVLKNENGDYDRKIADYIERYSVVARSELSCAFPDNRIGYGKVPERPRPQDAMNGGTDRVVAAL